MKNNVRFKKAKSLTINDFIKDNGKNLGTELNEKEKIKLCSLDSFNNVANAIYEKYEGKKAPVIIGQVGGFYVLASLAGIANYVSKASDKPMVLFFDRKENNIKNALFNTLLMKVCESKESYLINLLGLDNNDIVKALNPSLYVSYIESILGNDHDFSGLNKSEKKELLKSLYEEDKENIDKIISASYNTPENALTVLNSSFNLNKLFKYASDREYNKDKHLSILLNMAKGKLNKDTYDLFISLSKEMTDYLDMKDIYHSFANYLHTDMKTNSRVHILCDDDIYNGYRSLINKDTTGCVKFLPGVDISTKEGSLELKKVLKSYNFICEDTSSNAFQIDLSFLPHASSLSESYDLIKSNVENYVMLSKDGEQNNNRFLINSTATLHIRNFDNIGAQFIETERKTRKPLTGLFPMESREGFPLISFIAGANHGNIYHSETDTQNMIDMAIADHVDTVYIQGLIYATYFHHQTSRRLLNDPDYQTLDSRLAACKKIVKKLNDNGIKVVYQMGDEEVHLYQDLFKIYTREQGVIGNNFLAREDLRSKYDWVRPVIINELIPYLIRAGKDVTNFFTDEVSETRVSTICHALKLYKEGLPLGELSKYINPEYLEDTDMFRVVYSTVDTFDRDNEKISVNLLSNPNFSHITQYGKPNIGVIKNIRLHQTGSVKKYNEKDIPELFVDSRQGFMSLAYQGDQATLNVPQMIDDSYYIEHPELLPGIKEHILEDPTHKRVTQMQTRPNYPGGWEVSGDIRSRMLVMPYYRRVKEVMDYVQTTGDALPHQAVGYINDWQTGSPTERLYYDVKAMDYMLYEAKATGLFVNGDLQQGHNYPKFPNESRHLGSASVTQQMVSDVKLLRPFMRDAFGVITNGFENEIKDPRISKKYSDMIMNHLIKQGFIKHNVGVFSNMDAIKKDVDYSTIDLKLPQELKDFEGIIRDKLTHIILLSFIDLEEGNHEQNTDWNYKGYNEIELLRQELENIKSFSGADTDITLTEYLVNKNGDFVNASYGFRAINGYNNINGHAFKPAGKGGGISPTVAMNKYLDQMAGFSYRIDRANAAHYHIFEMSVIDNKLLTITGGGAGQSGYEQNLGYASQPCYVIDRYLPDGRIAIETIGCEFLDSYEIQNPYIKEIGIDKFIEECTTEEATIYDIDSPEKIQDLRQRKLVARKANTIIGPRID